VSSPRDVPAADLYARLGLRRGASTAQIHTAYRQLALALHPDSAPTRGGDPEALRLVIEAYQVLADPRERKLYDSKTSAARPTRSPSAAVCGVCRGTGTVTRPCLHCAGVGYVLANDTWLRTPTVCRVCHGRGCGIARCGACSGMGRTSTGDASRNAPPHRV
jgi:DnaJ-class molecular chaperone